ncbi:hypothetical protein NEOLEDRAFT_1140742 [Neolentinus lepideus HHB14362 ss-1]|uniref:Uncharacterized protein n=1 Tax=Neolentinus lepideus HHB14362 ss-1 TaxID=1314782 RepID=A0A165P342_9AGAM|nr:hypothetical protein NEOLEDRAFT_1140742 [Neolentinus lepideus HHB14362 ss-1]
MTMFIRRSTLSAFFAWISSLDHVTPHEFWTHIAPYRLSWSLCSFTLLIRCELIEESAVQLQQPMCMSPALEGFPSEWADSTRGTTLFHEPPCGVGDKHRYLISVQCKFLCLLSQVLLHARIYATTHGTLPSSIICTLYHDRRALDGHYRCMCVATRHPLMRLLY